MVIETLSHVHENLQTSSNGKVNTDSSDVSDIENHNSSTSFLFEEPFLRLCQAALFGKNPEEKDAALTSLAEQVSRFKDPNFTRAVDIRLRPFITREIYLQHQSASLYESKWSNSAMQRKMEIDTLALLASAPDNKVFVEMIARYVIDFDIYQSLSRQALPQFQQRFRSDAQNMTESGLLPVTMERIEDVIQRTRAIVFNIEEFDVGFDAAGVYFSEDSTIVFPTDRPLDYRCYAHEMIHALAGVTARQQINKLDTVEWPSIYHIREGIHYATGLKMPPFYWLNEAITESIAMNLSGASESSLYPAERKLYETILEVGGLDRALFTAAYFEHFDCEKEGEERNPAWRKLWQAIHSAYCPGFFLKLHKYVEMYGIEEATFALRANWQAIMKGRLLPFTLFAFLTESAEL